MAVDVEPQLHELSLQIDRLKVLYEQFFIGIEKGPPTVARKEAEKLLDFLGRQNIGNTAVRYRYLGLMRRWKTYAERWDKVLREIENGTYPKLRARLDRQRLAAERERPRPSAAAGAAVETGPARETDAAPTTAPATEPAGGEAAKPALASSPSLSPSLVPGMSDADLRSLHERYIEARRAAGEARPEVRYESLVTTLQKQLPDILERNHCKEVTFAVTLRDGKVILKAQPKR